MGLTQADLEKYRRDVSRHAFLHLAFREDLRCNGPSAALDRVRAALDAELEPLMTRKVELQREGFCTLLAWPDRPETMQ